MYGGDVRATETERERKRVLGLHHLQAGLGSGRRYPSYNLRRRWAKNREREGTRKQLRQLLHLYVELSNRSWTACENL